jgi:predicted acyltransferase
VLTGTWLRSERPALEKVSGMFFCGVVLLGLGLIWNSYFPMNKSLWTSSYVLTTSALALLVLGSCYWLIDIHNYRRWAKPFVIFGVNALALFVFTGIFARMIASYRVAGADGQPISIQRWIMRTVYLPIAQPIDASLLFALSFILLWLGLMWLLYREEIYIKV